MLTGVEGLLIFFFVALLVFGLYLLFAVYICDGGSCLPFWTCNDKYQKGTVEYVVELQRQFFNDGIWCIPFIGAAISTGLSLYFIGAPFTIRSFGCMFLISFLVYYCFISFIVHHYAKPIIFYTRDVISRELLNNKFSEDKK